MKYSLSPREILRAKHKGFPEGSGYISSYIPIQGRQTSSITTSALTYLEINIWRVCSSYYFDSWQYGKILPSWLRYTGVLNLNIIMCSNWKWYMGYSSLSAHFVQNLVFFGWLWVPFEATSELVPWKRMQVSRTVWLPALYTLLVPSLVIGDQYITE